VLYAVICYNSEAALGELDEQANDAMMARLAISRQRLVEQGKLGAHARLMPTTTATSIRAGGAAGDCVVLDGPFAETKEQLLGFYVLDCASLDEAIEAAGTLGHAIGTLEVRPIRAFFPGGPLR
jgi:hypothetical protein